MSVLIRGMEMPDCGENIIVLTSSGYVEDVSGQVIDGVEAVSVPPHGRLIDADVLRNLCDAPYWCVWLSEIDDSPTIIPSEGGKL